MSIDYSKTKIYKICSYLGDKIYIGRTTKKLLSQRLSKHRSNYKRWAENNETYMSSFILFNEYGVNNCYIELIEAKPCTDIDEARKLEGSYIVSLECVNKNIPGRTHKESDKAYYEKNKDRKKQYYQNNKESILQKRKEYNAKKKALKEGA